MTRKILIFLFFIFLNQLTDKKSIGTLDLHQIVKSLGIVCSDKYTEKLKLLYILHLPPLLTKSEIENTGKVIEKTVNKDFQEIGIEAEDFFRYLIVIKCNFI